VSWDRARPGTEIDSASRSDRRGRGSARLRLAVTSLALLVAGPGVPTTAQTPAATGSPTLPSECTSSPQLVNPIPVGLDDPGRAEPITVPAGATACLDYTPTVDTGQVTFDLRGLQPTSAYTAEAVSLSGAQQTWTSAPIEPGGRLQLCFDRVGEDLDRLYLLVSDRSSAEAVPVGGWIRVRPVALPCGRYAVHSRYTQYVGGQVSLSITVIGEISLSRDPLDDPRPNTLSYTIVASRPDQSDASTEAFGAAVARIGGLIAAADAGGDRGARCPPRTRLRYTGRTTITLAFAPGGPIEVDLDAPVARELVSQLFDFLVGQFGIVGMGMLPLVLLVTIAPLMLDLAHFQLALLAEQAFTRSGSTGCGLTTTRRTRTVSRLSDR
jgi:hypothetical protein